LYGTVPSNSRKGYAMGFSFACSFAFLPILIMHELMLVAMGVDAELWGYY